MERFIVIEIVFIGRERIGFVFKSLLLEILTMNL